MQGPECPPDGFGIVAFLVQLQQRRFQFTEQFARFVLEALLKLIAHPAAPE
jgi:hypothetical protein